MDYGERKYMKNKVLLLLITCLYVGIPILILLIPNMYEYKFYLLTIIGIAIYILLRAFRISNKDLGIKKENTLSSIKHNVLLITIFVILIIIFKLSGLAKYNPTETIWFYLFYIFISCPIQEFLYRAIFGYFEKTTLKNKHVALIISSLCYSFVHIIYKDIFTCILTFIIGIIWYYLYRKDYNLSGVVLNHIVLGILTISLGIVN